MVKWLKRGTPEFEELKHEILDKDDRIWVKLDTGEVLTRVAATSSTKIHIKGFVGWFSFLDGTAKEISELSVMYIMRPIEPIN